MDDAATRLSALVEAEYAALLSGNFDAMNEIVAEKLAVVGLLEEDPEADSILAPLREALARNQRLYDRALEGLRAVTARIGALNRARSSIRTYDRLGQEHRIAPTRPGTLERRA